MTTSPTETDHSAPEPGVESLFEEDRKDIRQLMERLDNEGYGIAVMMKKKTKEILNCRKIIIGLLKIH